MDGTVRAVRGPELTTAALYGLLRLRVDVFVVEQRCAYAELDGRDLDPGTVHFWIGSADAHFWIGSADAHFWIGSADAHFWIGSADAHFLAGPPEAPLAYLRLLTEPDGERRIGRVCTAAPVRGRGLAGLLLAAAVREVGDAPCVLAAQAHLVALYRGFGFAPSGPGYDWDGVPHVPMRRPSGGAPTRHSQRTAVRREDTAR